MDIQSEATVLPGHRRDGAAMSDDPAAFFNHSHTQMQTIDREELNELQLEGLRYRLAQLRPLIPMLGKLADKQNIDQLDAINDIVPLLFEHTMYKSYPPMLLEKNRFADIGRWLTKLSCHDITGIDVSSCEGIDDWLAVMDSQSPLKICHTSGTSGTVSFLPFSKSEWDKHGRAVRITLLQPFGEEVSSTVNDDIYCIHPYFRDGGSSHLRFNDLTVKFIVGSEERFLAAYPERMSSDMLYLAAKMRAAQTKGELDRLQISENLLARRSELARLELSMPMHLEKFFDRAITELRGKRIYFAGTWSLLHGMAKRGLEKGLEGLFATDSIVMTFGGAKGMVPPPNWQEDIRRFIGLNGELQKGYGMSEIMGMHYMCKNKRYHFVPWVVPFLLDPNTSKALPRHGKVTGRAAFFDLAAATHWGGFISGDEITINWDHPCECGRTSVYVEGDIQRYSEKDGGDDKISCAATENAHKEAMDFLTKFE